LDIPNDQNKIYLTFDGPTPEITDWIVITKKTWRYSHFFCIGKNIVNNPEIFKDI
jgi:hypothetical protein